MLNSYDRMFNVLKGKNIRKGVLGSSSSGDGLLYCKVFSFQKKKKIEKRKSIFRFPLEMPDFLYAHIKTPWPNS